jgi:protocatechuate 3,4-dioxygenase beta subunit
MKAMRLIVALLPLVTAAQTAPDTLCAISGQVVNASTAEPVRRATVYLRRTESSPGVTTVSVTHSVSTDASGHFAIDKIEPGAYRLAAEHSGFIVTQYGARGPGKAGTPLILERGQKSTDLLLRLTPHSVISGRVLDEDGEPVTGVDVQVSRLQYVQGRKQLARSGGGATNDLGEYRVFGLAPGRYYLSASYRPNPIAPDADANGEGAYVPTYYPNTPDPSAAAPLDATPGSQLSRIDVTLARRHTVTVRGTVVNEAMPESAPGDPAVRVNMSVVLSAINPMGAGRENSRGAQVSPQGVFEIRNVVPGSYLLSAMAMIPGKTARTARVPLQVGSANLEGIAVTIHAPLAITGHVQVDGETSENLSRLHVMLLPLESGAMVYGPLPDQALKPDGSFRMPEVNPDRYRVNVNPLPDGFYVKSIRAANVDVQTNGLDAGGGAPAPLEIVVSPNAGRVSGSVLDPKTQRPVSGVFAVLVPQEAERRDRESFYHTATTDPNGRFTFQNLVPGEYKVYSWEAVDFGAWMDPDFLAPHESQGEPVTVREGSPQSVQVRLIPDQ